MSRPLNIDKLRAHIRALQAERDTLTTQTRSRAEVAAMLDRMIDNAATAGAAMLASEIASAVAGGPVAPLNLRGIAPVPRAPGVASVNLNAAPLLVALLGPLAVKAALSGAVASIPEGMPAADRLARLEAIGADLDRLETEEEALCTRDSIDRRPDARPEVVLGVL